MALTLFCEGTGLNLALTTGYLRLAADKHDLSDVVVGDTPPAFTFGSVF